MLFCCLSSHTTFVRKRKEVLEVRDSYDIFSDPLESNLLLVKKYLLIKYAFTIYTSLVYRYLFSGLSVPFVPVLKFISISIQSINQC